MSSSAWRERRDLFGVPHRCPRAAPAVTDRCTVCGFLESEQCRRPFFSAVIFSSSLDQQRVRSSRNAPRRSRRNDSITKGFVLWKSVVRRSHLHRNISMLSLDIDLLSRLLEIIIRIAARGQLSYLPYSRYLGSPLDSLIIISSFILYLKSMIYR